MSGHQTDRHPTRPLVSVIIATFNRERFLAQALESAFAQLYRPVEVVVVDDGSGDKTLDMLRGWPEVVCVPQKHRGVSAARNTGIARSSGSFVAFLDSDDIWPVDGLTAAVEYLKAHPNVGYVLGRQVLFADPGYEMPNWVKHEWQVKGRDTAGAGVMVARRDIWVRVGEFNTSLAQGEDMDWLARAEEEGIPMARMPVVFVHSRLHGGNLTLSVEDRKLAMARVLRDSIRRRSARKSP